MKADFSFKKSTILMLVFLSFILIQCEKVTVDDAIDLLLDENIQKESSNTLENGNLVDNSSSDDSNNSENDGNTSDNNDDNSVSSSGSDSSNGSDDYENDENYNQNDDNDNDNDNDDHENDNDDYYNDNDNDDNDVNGVSTDNNNSGNSFNATGTIWQGTILSFSKSDNANPSLEENQDRITDNVWITRGNEGKQIFNMAKRTLADKNTSPVGTEWSIGTIDQLSQLVFKNLRDTSGNKPKSLVGKNMVLHLVEDNIYLSIKFTSWSSGTKGGFAYERSTPK